MVSSQTGELTWLTNNPWGFAPENIFSQIISSYHFTIVTKHFYLYRQWQVRVARIGIDEKWMLYLALFVKILIISIWQLIFTSVATEGKSFSLCNCCWLCRFLSSLWWELDPLLSWFTFWRIFSVYFWEFPLPTIEASITWHKRPVQTIAIRLLAQPPPLGTINHHIDLAPPWVTLPSEEFFKTLIKHSVGKVF